MPYLLVSLVLLLAWPARAQSPPPTNRALLERLALDCLPPDVGGAVVLVVDGVPAFVTSAVERRLIASGARVYRADADVAEPAARLGLARWTNRIGLTPRGRLVDRVVTAQADVRLELPDGRVAHVETCRGEARDRFERTLAPTLEDPLVPETAAAPVPPSRLRRWAEPALAAAGVVVGVLLLYSVRS